MDIISLLRFAKLRGASDVHLVVYNVPVLRVNGYLEQVDDMSPLTEEDMDDTLRQLASEGDMGSFKKDLELDFGCSVPKIGRFRVNVARQRGTTSFVIRLLPMIIPGIDELGLPEVCKELVFKRRGMVVVSGPTGSGKSTTLAAMINYLNQRETRRVVTVEDPVEYVYQNAKCIVTQRELGSDTTSFSEALRHVLRQDPNVILIGEMRDTETAAAAITIAETGHLVLTTGHASSASQSVERIVDLFPPHERNLVQSRLATLLLGVLCQALVPKADGTGRAVAVEVMLANSAIRNLIREGKIFQLPNVIRTHVREGMQLLDQALIRLYRDEVINKENLFSFCNDHDEVEKLIGNAELRASLAIPSEPSVVAQ